MVIDGVSYLTDAVYTIGAQPSKALTDWVADWAAPSYWKPNIEIIVSFDNFNQNQKSKCKIRFSLQNCHGCKTNFERTGLHKHHCRACGEGFCNPCSMHQMPVPARGWTYPVRVCNSCKDILSNKRDARPGKRSIMFIFVYKKISFYCLLSILFMKLQYQLNQTTTKNIEIFV